MFSTLLPIQIFERFHQVVTKFQIAHIIRPLIYIIILIVNLVHQRLGSYHLAKTTLFLFCRISLSGSKANLRISRNLFLRSLWWTTLLIEEFANHLMVIWPQPYSYLLLQFHVMVLKQLITYLFTSLVFLLVLHVFHILLELFLSRIYILAKFAICILTSSSYLFLLMQDHIFLELVLEWSQQLVFVF